MTQDTCSLGVAIVLICILFGGFVYLWVKSRRP